MVSCTEGRTKAVGVPKLKAREPICNSKPNVTEDWRQMHEDGPELYCSLSMGVACM